MRTTVAIDDLLLEQAKQRAAERQITLGQLVEESLARALMEPAPAPRPRFPVHRAAGGLRPGVDGASNRSMLDALDEDELIA